MELSSDTAELLRPTQVAEMGEEIKNLEDMLNAPPHIRSQITDRGMMSKRLKRLRSEAEVATPRAYAPGERDAAVAEFKTLSEAIRVGMPSNEEMRRNPPGAVGKQIAWQKRTKTAVQRYKHIALRLLAGGDQPAHLQHEGDVANIELLRPLKTTQDLAMDGAQIGKVRDIHIGADIVGTVLFTAAEESALKEYAPALAGALAVMDNDARAEVKALLVKLMASAPPATAEPEQANAAKPSISDLTYNEMKSMARKAGIDCKSITRKDLITALRTRHLAQ